MNFISEYNKVSIENYGDGFVGANSGKGFIGYYDDIINESELNRLYVIKGAAGTGKSTFMRNLADKAENCGLNVKRYMCSSDYESLDTVVVSDKVAVIDGTNPHSYELKYPGAVSEILDYTKFWDNTKLIKHRDDIIHYSDLKSTAYSEAYLRLRCEMNMRNDSYNSICSSIDRNKMVSQINRFVSTFAGKCKRGNSRRMIYHSVGMKGRYRLPFETKNLTKIIKVSDVYGSAYVYMTEFVNQLIKNNIEHIIIHDPVCPEYVCDVIIPSIDYVITIDDVTDCDKIINMSRFVDNDLLSHIRGFLRLSSKCIRLFSEEADYYLSLAGKAHFELEKIYGDAMNFDFLNTYSEIKIKEIIDSVKL